MTQRKKSPFCFSHVVSSLLCIAPLPSSEINFMFSGSTSRRRKRLGRNDAEILTLLLGSLHSLFADCIQFYTTLYRYLNFSLGLLFTVSLGSHPHWERVEAEAILLCLYFATMFCILWSHRTWNSLEAAFAPILPTWTNGTNECNCPGQWEAPSCHGRNCLFGAKCTVWCKVKRLWLPKSSCWSLKWVM